MENNLNGLSADKANTSVRHVGGSNGVKVVERFEDLAGQRPTSTGQDRPKQRF